MDIGISGELLIFCSVEGGIENLNKVGAEGFRNEIG